MCMYVCARTHKTTTDPQQTHPSFMLLSSYPQLTYKILCGTLGNNRNRQPHYFNKGRTSSFLWYVCYVCILRCRGSVKQPGPASKLKDRVQRTTQYPHRMHIKSYWRRSQIISKDYFRHDSWIRVPGCTLPRGTILDHPTWKTMAHLISSMCLLHYIDQPCCLSKVIWYTSKSLVQPHTNKIKLKTKSWFSNEINTK